MTRPPGGPAGSSKSRPTRGRDDRASHARFGETARNRVMFGRPGVAYVYLVYGMYDCLNVVTGPDGEPSAVLIRAVEPVEGIDAMRIERLTTVTSRRRSMSPERVEAERARLATLAPDRLASGPGLVAAAFGLDDCVDRRGPLRPALARPTGAGGSRLNRRSPSSRRRGSASRTPASRGSRCPGGSSPAAAGRSPGRTRLAEPASRRTWTAAP